MYFNWACWLPECIINKHSFLPEKACHMKYNCQSNKHLTRCEGDNITSGLVCALLLPQYFQPFIYLDGPKANTIFLGLSPRQGGGTSFHQGQPFITCLWQFCGADMGQNSQSVAILPFLPPWPSTKGLWLSFIYSHRFFSDISKEFQCKFRLSCSTPSAERNPQWSLIDSAAPYGGPLNWSRWQQREQQHALS